MKFPSVRCEAKPMITPSTAVEASSPPATARTCGNHEQRGEEADDEDGRRDGAPEARGSASSTSGGSVRRASHQSTSAREQP